MQKTDKKTINKKKKKDKKKDLSPDFVTIIKLTVRVLGVAALLVYLICCALGIIDIPEGIKFEMPFSE